MWPALVIGFILGSHLLFSPKLITYAIYGKYERDLSAKELMQVTEVMKKINTYALDEHAEWGIRTSYFTYSTDSHPISPSIKIPPDTELPFLFLTGKDILLFTELKSNSSVDLQEKQLYFASLLRNEHSLPQGLQLYGSDFQRQSFETMDPQMFPENVTKELLKKSLYFGLLLGLLYVILGFLPKMEL